MYCYGVAGMQNMNRIGQRKILFYKYCVERAFVSGNRYCYIVFGCVFCSVAGDNAVFYFSACL